MVIVLEVSPKLSNQRIANGQDIFENDQKLLTEVHKNYRKLAKQFKWNIIDGEKSKEQVHQEVLSVVRKFLKV
jgi:thymidylate kinase